MTEHAAVIFVFFFLAEYASIVLICIFTSILFIGGYLFNYIYLISVINDIFYFLFIIEFNYEDFLLNPLFQGMLYAICLGLKTCILIFIFV
jgi:NADH-ubiquinone oxidoreductase chain 1